MKRSSVMLSLLLLAFLFLGFGAATYFNRGPLAEPPGRDVYLKQLENNDDVPRQIREDYRRRNNRIATSLCLSIGASLLAGLMFVQITQLRQEGLKQSKPRMLNDL